MNARAWWQLAVLSIRDPAQAAVALLAMRPGRDVLWPALLLAAALNTLVFSLSDILLPAPPVFPPILHQPLAYFAMITLGLVGFIQLLAWIGRLLGGWQIRPVPSHGWRRRDCYRRVVFPPPTNS